MDPHLEATMDIVAKLLWKTSSKYSPSIIGYTWWGQIYHESRFCTWVLSTRRYSCRVKPSDEWKKARWMTSHLSPYLHHTSFWFNYSRPIAMIRCIIVTIIGKRELSIGFERYIKGKSCILYLMCCKWEVYITETVDSCELP